MLLFYFTKVAFAFLSFITQLSELQKGEQGA
jgi:hypothetical protein